MAHAVVAFESIWMSPFWALDAVLLDHTFNYSIFFNYLSTHVIKARPVPPRRHNKNPLEAKHKMIWNIFLRLKGAFTHSEPPSTLLLFQHALRISNDQKSNNILSAYGLPIAFLKAILLRSFPALIPYNLGKAHKSRVPKRKPKLILRSKATQDIPLAVSGLVQVFWKQQHKKCVCWSSLVPVLSFDLSFPTVNVPGNNGHIIFAALKDIRLTISHDDLPTAVQQALDALHFSMSNNLD